MIPENLKAYALFRGGNAVTDLLGLDIQASDIDVADFGEDQKEVLRQTVSNARAAGRNFIKYEDYPAMATGDKPHEYYRGAREKRSDFDLIRESFSDPVFEMFTTLGVFSFEDQPDGGFEILPDAYDFNASKSPKNRTAKDAYSEAVYKAQDISGDQSYRFNVSGIVAPKTVDDLVNPKPGNIQIAFAPEPAPEPTPEIDARPKSRPETPQPEGTVLTGTATSSIDSMLEDRPEPEPDIPAPQLDTVDRPKIDAGAEAPELEMSLLPQQEVEAAFEPDGTVLTGKPVSSIDSMLEDRPEPEPDVPEPALDSVDKPKIDVEAGAPEFETNLLSQQELEAAIDPAKPVPARDAVETRQLEDIPEPAPRPMPRPDTGEEVEAATPIPAPDAVEQRELGPLPEPKPQPEAVTPASAPAPAPAPAPQPSRRSQPRVQLSRPAPQPVDNGAISIQAALRMADPNAIAGVVENYTPDQRVDYAPSGVAEKFGAAFTSGLEGLDADLNYFGALLQGAMGNEKGVEAKVYNARVAESLSAEALAGLESFEEFLDEPTVGGFIDQVLIAGGQITPAAIGTVATALATGGTGIVAPLVTQTGRKTVSNITKGLVRQAAEKKARGELLDEAEETILQGSYNYLRNAKRAAIGGAFGVEYPQMAGAIGGEFDDAGRPIDASASLLGLVGGVPLAGVGVAGEKLVAEALVKTALKRAPKDAAETNVFRQYASDVAKGAGLGGVTELGTELVQEGTLVALRSQIDETFTAEDAQLRLAQAAFAGFFGGAGISGAGATIASTVRQAKGMLETRQQAFADASLSVSETGAGFSDRPTAESSVDINAQVNAALDPTRGKPAAWIPETSGTPTNLGLDSDNTTVEVRDVDGSVYYAAKVPGKGTIISRSKGVVDAVVEGGATDPILAEALGYSATRPDSADRVVRVKDADGNIISEEATDVDGQEAAQLAAARIAGETDTIDVVDVETALKERKARYDEGRTREMINEEDPDFTEEDAARSQGLNIIEEDGGLPTEEQVTVFSAGDPEKRSPDYDDKFQRFLSMLPEERVAEFEALKDFMSDSALNFFIQVTETDPEYTYFAEVVDGRLSVGRILTGRGIESGPVESAIDFIFNSEAAKKIKKSKRPRFFYIQTINTETGELGERIPTTIGMLIGAGLRINQRSRESLVGEGLTSLQAQKQAMIRIIKELRTRGFEVQTYQGDPVTMTSRDGRLRNSLSAQAMQAAGIESMPSYRDQSGNVSTFSDIINAADPRPAPNVSEARQQVRGRKAGEKAVQRFDRQRERRRQELQDDGESLERIDEILAEEFSEERRQEVGREAQRDSEIVGPNREAADPTGPRRRVNPRTGVTTVDIPEPGLEGQPDGLVDPIGRAADEAVKRGVFRGEAADIETQRQIDVREGNERTIRRRNIQRDPVTRTAGGPVALTQEAARVLGPVDVPNIAQPNIFSRILLEDMPLPQPTSTKKPKNRRQRRAARNEAPRTILNDNLPPIASRIFGTASKLFSFDKTIHVISLSDLQANPEKYTEGNYKAIAGWLENTINRMAESPTQGRYLPTGDAHVIVINDLDAAGGQVSDAALGAVLAHEVGHIVFQTEFQKILDNPALKKRLWEGFKQHLEGMDEIPSQYDLTKEGFEEWYADQVASYVYDQAKSAKTGRDSYFKSIAKKLVDFFDQVNKMLGGRLTQNEVFKEYMDGVVSTHRNNRKAIISDSNGKVLGMVEQIGIREMIQEIKSQDFWPTIEKNYQTLAARVMRSPTYKWLNKWLSSTDGWLRDQGAAGIELAKFFNNKSSSLEQTGFHQAKTVMFNRFVNKLGDIFEMDVTENEKAWDDPLIEQALLLAENEKISDAELAARTDEAAKKATRVRKLFSDIFDQYIVNPNTKRPFFRIKKRANYAPRMLDFVKIEQNPEAFVDFLRQQGVEEFRIKAIMDSLSLSEYSEDFDNFSEDDLPELVKARIAELREQGAPESEIQQIIDSSILQMTVERQKAQETARLVDETMSELDDEAVSRKARLSPGMDQAAARSLQDISTESLRNAIPEDKHGFLVPPGLGMVQYFHQVTRKVEFERRGGFNKINELLEQIPEEDRAFAEEIIQGNLGKRGAGMGKGWRTFNSIAAVHTVTTTLLFTVFASVTDLSGIAVRMKEAENLGDFFKETMRAGRDSIKKDSYFDRLYDWAGFETDRERLDFARDVGVVSMEALDNMFISVGELDFADAWARKAMGTFFEYTGLQWYTRATRILAAKMGEKFIIRTATKQNFDETQQRYLAELGLTREQVLENYDPETESLNLYGPNADIIRKAIARFAEEAIIRPNPAQRPSWANNPYLTVVWQLKSYFYAYGKTVIGGIGREVVNRYNRDGNFYGGAQIMLLAAAFMIPLTMLGLELRELFKWFAQALLPGVEASGRVFRTNYMDGPEYAYEIFERSGVLGPLSLGLTTVESLKWEGAAGPLIANIPFIDAFDDTFIDGDWNRPIPVLNNIQ